MSRRRVAYLNARLIDPESGLDAPGALLTEGDAIADFGPRLFNGGDVPANADIVDCRGRVLCPGLVDMRVFVGEPGFEHKETLASAGQAAAAGGVTTIVTMPGTDPVIDEVALVEYVARRARETSLVRVHPMAAITKGLGGEVMTEFGLLAEGGAVAFTDGDQAVADAAVMRRALSYASAFGLLLCDYPQEPALARDGAMNEGEPAMRLGLSGIPNAAEAIVLERDARLVALTGGRCHASAISTADSVEIMRRVKAQGLPMTAACAPHNFALNDNAVGEYRTFAKTNPPLRDEADRQAVVEGLREGLIEVISSGHDPQDPDAKRLPFEQAASGVIGLETMLPLALELVHNGHLTLVEALRKMTSAPARLLRLPGGRLAKGAPADLLVFDLDLPWRIDDEAFRSKSKNSPFGGRPVQGRAWRTVVDGRCVFDRDADG
jgi:dihydroorotase